mgnify:CR=1 FL=1
MKVRRKQILIMLLIDAVLLTLLFFAKDLVLLAMAIIPTCPFVTLGYQCPACGGTRCVFNILKFNFATAFNFNPFVFVLFFYALVCFLAINLYFLFNLKWAQKVYKAMLNPKIIIVFAVIFAIFGIVRNFI